MTEIKVPIERKFLQVHPNQDDVYDEVSINTHWLFDSSQTWDNLDNEYRTIILAGAGTGKTYECLNRAKYINQKNIPAFFIRIEDIDSDFEDSFEVGTSKQFREWLLSTEEAWFYLDSIDEAKLKNPRNFEKAIKKFSRSIASAKDRTHIYITSRPYAWQFKYDNNLINKYLPYETHRLETQAAEDNFLSNEHDLKQEDVLKIYNLCALNEQDIQKFASYHSITDSEVLIAEILKKNLMEIASRPFDLEALLLKWKSEKGLNSRLETLQYMIDARLNEIDPDRKRLQPLNIMKALEGARRLAAAVTLSGKAGILVPDNSNDKTGVDAEQILADWDNSNDIRALLERGLFNDVLYGSVRFRHRDIRELLTAQWLYNLLKKNKSRRSIESLFFQQKYGEEVIVPRLRPILSWLILFDSSICSRVTSIQPEVAIEGGDAASLPIEVRHQILNNIIKLIVNTENSSSVQDNYAIAQLAQKDLSNTTLELIKHYGSNDNAVIFLARLAWLGNMEACIPVLIPIAINSNRDINSRVFALRAIATVSSEEVINNIWKEINDNSATLSKKILKEIIEVINPDKTSIELLLISIEKLPENNEEYESIELHQAVHFFIEKFENLSPKIKEILLRKLCIGFHDFLNRKPNCEDSNCIISHVYSWLLPHANHAVKFLISDHSDICFSSEIIDILLKSPIHRSENRARIKKYNDKLLELIPQWEELNDLLFWKSIEGTRARFEQRGFVLTDYNHVGWLGYFWRFEINSFDRVVNFIHQKEGDNDKLVALSLAYDIYITANKPSGWEELLTTTISGNQVLTDRWDRLINPPKSSDNILIRDIEQEESVRESNLLEEAKNRLKWIEKLRSNPGLVRRPLEVPAGELTDNQFWLLREIDDISISTKRAKGIGWQSLTSKFGKDVALAFRDAAIDHWRYYKPQLKSEGADTKTIPYSLIFAMLGLEFESVGVKNFVTNLKPAEIENALRFLHYEINGFPSWLEKLNVVYPQNVLSAIWKELVWELDNLVLNSSHTLLEDIVYHAPWVHKQLAPLIQQYIEVNENIDWKSLDYFFRILSTDNLPIAWFSNIAKTRINSTTNISDKARWFAIWVDADPEVSIIALKSWLTALDFSIATVASQEFIVQLLGGIHGSGNCVFLDKYRTAPYLKTLFVLMHQFIKVEHDLDRRRKGVHSPNLRDNAQDARDALFRQLSEIPGKETYSAFKDLVHTHPVESHRIWMLKQAKKRAEKDSDSELWSDKDVYDFSSSLERKIQTHEQLFEAGILNLYDFKDWLERGNDSLHDIYQRVNDESQMRRIVANWINDKANGRYTCAQENPLANEQRPDLWLQHHEISTPVPIELKLLDKGWSGSDLCERLRNQLVGDYLREKEASCGIFLLVWAGSKNNRKWEINSIRVGVTELEIELKKYWNDISHNFPHVSNVEIIVIDLTLRAKKSNL